MRWRMRLREAEAVESQPVMVGSLLGYTRAPLVVQEHVPDRCTHVPDKCTHVPHPRSAGKCSSRHMLQSASGTKSAQTKEVTGVGGG